VDKPSIKEKGKRVSKAKEQAGSMLLVFGF